MPSLTATELKPMPQPDTDQSCFSPPSGQLFSRPVSWDVPFLSEPRNWGQEKLGCGLQPEKAASKSRVADRFDKTFRHRYDQQKVRA